MLVSTECYSINDRVCFEYLVSQLIDMVVWNNLRKYVTWFDGYDCKSKPF